MNQTNYKSQKHTISLCFCVFGTGFVIVQSETNESLNNRNYENLKLSISSDFN